MKINKTKPVIISTNKKNYFKILMNVSGYEVHNLYRGQSFILRNLRKIWFKYKLPYPQIWFKVGFLNKNYETIILFDALVTKEYIIWLKKKNKNKRIIFWYWNPVQKSLNSKLLNNNIYEKWSYSQTDCDNLNLKYNTQFYFKDIKIPRIKLVYDIFFLGRDKGRLSELLDLKKQFETLNLNVNFHIAPTNRKLIRKGHSYQKLLSYDEALKEIAKSKAILDILNDPQDGLSMRAMESIFHEKKLITNSQKITNYDFYSPQNIFILGKDKLEDLQNFVNSAYKKIDKKIIENYDFTNWVKRFY